jgi:hypothetical protein
MDHAWLMKFIKSQPNTTPDSSFRRISSIHSSTALEGPIEKVSFQTPGF